MNNPVSLVYLPDILIPGTGRAVISHFRPIDI